MASPSPANAQSDEPHLPAKAGGESSSQEQIPSSQPSKTYQANSQSSDHLLEHDSRSRHSSTPDTPGVLPPFDWADYEARYEMALEDAKEDERDVMKEAASLSKVGLTDRQTLYKEMSLF